MEKTILSPEAFELWFSPGEDKKTGCARAVGCADGELILRRTEAVSGAFASAESWWLLSEAEYKDLLIEALKRGKIAMADFTALQKRGKPAEGGKKKPEPVRPERKPGQEYRICRSEGVEIGLLKDERPYLRLDGEEYTLSSQPFETSTLIRKNSRVVVTLRNAFEIYGAYDRLAEGEPAESAAGGTYDAPALCALLAAALRVNRETLELAELEAMLAPDEADEADEEPEAEERADETPFGDALPEEAPIGDGGTRSGFLFNNFKD